MPARPDEKPVRSLAVMVAIVVGVFAAPMAFARITANTIDPVARVTDHGRQLVVTGPIACAEGERLHLRVTVTQRTTGAVAEGRTLVPCTGATQQWEVRASAHGRETFEEGPATAVALGRTTEGGTTTDAHQWLVDVTLTAQAM
jgi:hypothetical protein